MAKMLAWPEIVRGMITLLLTFCVVAQALALVLSHYRHPRSRIRKLENLLELCALFQIFVCTLLHGQMLLDYELSLIAPTEAILLRYVAFILTALLAIAVMVVGKQPWPLSMIIASGLTLPVMESILGNAFAFIYVAVMFFWLLRGVHICLLRTREIRTSLSVLSVKNAIDTLHSGVLFGETDGFILLHNRQMQRLMLSISGGVRRNGWVFYEQLSNGDVQPGCRIAELEGQLVCLLDDGTAWMFTKSDLNIKGKTYVQLTASDITQRWDLTARLQLQEDLLKQRSDELNKTIANLQNLSRQRETQKAKMRAHDILGQRLTLLLRTIRSEETLGYDVLQALSQGLMDDLKTGQRAPRPLDELVGLKQAFLSIGVTILIDGALPEEETKGRLFVDIIRESVTNAVRHGFATNITVSMEHTSGGHKLVITNDGRLPTGPISEGGGIGGMRNKVEPHGGTVDVITHPQFVLAVDLPGGEMYV
ncbi:hypothetical protein LJC42_08055 [Eubacteriales bacterium OttesenSCG-928-K08]|nr:hypothetical protein [Eubacteriales bacterium OttesenSCG-928-K08]